MSSAESGALIEIRPPRDLREIEDLWWPLMQILGWNRALEDAATHHHSSGADGWLMLVPKETLRPEGCVVPFVFDNGTGWVGFFIMNAAYRGRGWGGALFKANMDHFASRGVSIVGLDAVQQQVGTYARRGFVEKARIRLMVRPSLQQKPLEKEKKKAVLEEDESVLPLLEPLSISHSVLAGSDLAHTGLQRDKLWEAICRREDAFGYALLRKEDRSSPLGWILVRECEHGYRFGPLYAQDGRVASLLLEAAMEPIQGEEDSLIAEVWPENPQAVDMFERHGWTLAGMDYHRMWLNGAVPKEQQPGGKAEREMWAIFDAAEG